MYYAETKGHSDRKIQKKDGLSVRLSYLFIFCQTNR